MAKPITNESMAVGGVLDLLAHRDAITLRDQPPQIALRRVERYTGHGDTAGAFSEGEPENAVG